VKSTPLAQKLGAEVHDLDLGKPLSDAQVAELRQL